MNCSRCGKPLTAETSVYSPYRKVWYCATGWDECDRIFRERQEAK